MGLVVRGVPPLLHYLLPMVATRNHESRKGHRLDRHRLLHQPVEQQAARPGGAALKKSPMPAVMAVKEYARFAVKMDTQAAVDFAKNLHATVNSSSAMRP